MVIEDIFPGEGEYILFIYGCAPLCSQQPLTTIYPRKAVRKIDFLHAKLYNEKR